MKIIGIKKNYKRKKNSCDFGFHYISSEYTHLYCDAMLKGPHFQEPHFISVFGKISPRTL